MTTLTSNSLPNMTKDELMDSFPSTGSRRRKRFVPLPAPRNAA
jgi:hypothetical protein